MQVFTDIASFKQFRCSLAKGLKVAFVPTMGNLHEGHLSLIKLARLHADCVIVSIFVNPTQFLPHEDFDSYPRSFTQDCDYLKAENVDAVFAPDMSEIYPNEQSKNSVVHVKSLENLLCGASRPGFFSAVCSVLLRLFNFVRPDKVFMGEKDYQQVLIVKQMCLDFFLDIKVISCPIVRTEQGLALSSRLGYLSAAQIKQAEYIFRMLQKAQVFFEKGNTDVSDCIKMMQSYLHENTSIKIDYLSFVHHNSLNQMHTLSRQGLFVFAGYLDGVRLIDNYRLV